MAEQVERLESTPEFRAALAQGIHAFHAEAVPLDQRRIAFRVTEADGALAAGLSAVLSWGWMFVEAVWVAPPRRGEGLGARMLAAAEAEAARQGCHSAWLDTFRAREFYLAQGYEEFAALPGYPGGQARHFLRKALPAICEAATDG
jgi:GNAT superfamily N-acetyltransferase